MHGVGQGVYARRLIEGLLRHVNSQKFRITILVPHHSTDPIEAMPSHANWMVLKSPRPAHPLLDTMAWNQRLLAHRSLFDPGVLFFSPGPCWGWRAPRNLALTHHDCIYRHYPVYLGRRFIRKWSASMTERYLHRAKIVFTESEHARADIADQTGLPISRIQVIPAWLPPAFNVVTARSTREQVRLRHALPERYWLYVGGYDIRKNVEFLLDAYAQARARTECPPLVLAGGIPGQPAPTYCDVRGRLRALQLSAPALVEPGFIPDDDMLGLYAGAELMIYPSLFEGYGLPPLEAMGCGCPALVADNTSLREVVTDRTHRFATETTEELTDLLVQAAHRPLPLNPSFAPAQHDERRAMELYFRSLEDMAASV